MRSVLVQYGSRRACATRIISPLVAPYNRTLDDRCPKRFEFCIRSLVQQRQLGCAVSAALSVNASSVNANEVGDSIAAGRPIGQPAYSTHPHLVSARELNPGIPAEEFVRRRREFLAKLPPNSLVILPGASLKYHGHDVFYPFRQAPDFQWLTGFQEPGAAAVFHTCESSKGGSFARANFSLFVPGRDYNREMWDGSRAGVEGALELFGCDAALPITRLMDSLRSMLDEFTVEHLFIDRSAEPAVAQHVLNVCSSWLEGPSNGNTPRSFVDPLPIVEKLRIIKSKAEIEIMRKSANIAAAAHVECMRATASLSYEYQVAALFEYSCKSRGAQRVAYPTILASGNHATTLHYVQNNDVLRPGELILMDAGCELHGYCSDITRCWPISGTYSNAQRELYDVVLAANQECMAELRRSNHSVSLDDLQRLTNRSLHEGLLALGFKFPHSSISVLYPHMIGHFLGLDTHDTHGVRKDTKLLPGTIITIEPGLYVPRVDRRGMQGIDIPERFRGIGVRIEDDVVITHSGIEVLTEGVPKTAVEIENIMRV